MKWRLVLIAFFLLLGGGCASSTAHIPPVSGFEAEKYLGTWYEIARLPHGFENGLSRVYAVYILNPDNERISVVNHGFDERRQEWREARGTAVFSGARNTGLLEVSFFRPFWGDYKIILLDHEYRYAMVTSSRMSYLWILSRSPRMDEPLLKKLIGKAAAWGFETDALILVEQ